MIDGRLSADRETCNVQVNLVETEAGVMITLHDENGVFLELEPEEADDRASGCEWRSQLVRSWRLRAEKDYMSDCHLLSTRETSAPAILGKQKRICERKLPDWEMRTRGL